MAQFNTDLTVKPTQYGSNIGDMLNIARGAQAYQQTQQLNPLQLEQQKQITSQSQMTTQTQERQINADQISYLKKQAMRAINDPDVRNGDPQAILRVLNGAETESSLVIKDPKIISSIFGPLKAEALKDPKRVVQSLTALAQSNISPAEQAALQTPQLGTVANQPALFRPGPGTVESVQLGETKPLATITATDMSKPVYSQSSPLPHPVREAGKFHFPNPSEQTDLQSGQKFREGLTTRQSQLVSAKRNVDEVLKVADEISKDLIFTTGMPGDIERKARSFLGDERYKQLSKDLANLQIANIQAMGGSMDTVGGQNLQKLASGDETYPPKVIMDITNRVKADLKNIDLQATAAQKFFNKFGDNNMKAFQQDWAKNADSQIFEVMNISENPKLTKAQKEAQVNKILGNDPKQRQIFHDKYQNLKKMIETGTLQ